jgi:hypothetical protein
MLDHLIQPRLLKPSDFVNFAATWKQLVNANPLLPGKLTLSQVFTVYDTTSQSSVMNYVYLPNDYAVALLSAVGTVAVQAKFVVVARDSKPLSVFSIVLFGIDGFGNSTTAYYLAGVANNPAAVVHSTKKMQTPVKSVGLDLAGNWIMNWNALKQQSKDKPSIDATLFNSMYGPVLGYTYPLDDFLDALFPAKMKLDRQALWLNFALHKYNKPEATDDAYSHLFSTVLTLNNLPTETLDSSLAATADGSVSGNIDLSSSDSYYDVSRPSPPY